MHWWVVTPEYWTYSSDWYEPPELGADVVSVEADTKRGALIAGLRELRNIKSNWIDNREADEGNPFAGLRVESPYCEHGVCHCGKCQSECHLCIDAITNEVQP